MYFLGLWTGEIYNGWANWATSTGNVKQHGAAIRGVKDKMGQQKVNFNLGTATVDSNGGVTAKDDQITITVTNVQKNGQTWNTQEADLNKPTGPNDGAPTVKAKIEELAKAELQKVNGAENIGRVSVAAGEANGQIKLTVCTGCNALRHKF